MKSVSGSRGAVLLCAGLLLLVSCSSDDSVSEELVSANVAVEETTTTAATTMSTIASTTTTSSSTTTTTTTVPETTTTTEPEPVVETVANTDVDGSVPDSGPPDIMDGIEIPVNTMFDPATPEGEVEVAVLAENETYKQCLRTLPDCDVAAATRFGAQDFKDGAARGLSDWNERGIAAERADTVLVTVEAVEFPFSSVEADVFICVTDDSRLFIPGPDGGLEEVVEEGFYSSRRQLLVTKILDQWLIVASETLESTDGIENNLCV